MQKMIYKKNTATNSSKISNSYDEFQYLTG